MLRMAYRIDADALPKADLVVSAGGETLMPNICVTRLFGVPNIYCGSLLRGLGPENFSLVISSYDRDAGSPRHLVTLKPSAIDPDALGRPASVPVMVRSGGRAWRAFSSAAMPAPSAIGEASGSGCSPSSRRSRRGGARAG